MRFQVDHQPGTRLIALPCLSTLKGIICFSTLWYAERLPVLRELLEKVTLFCSIRVTFGGPGVTKAPHGLSFREPNDQ